MAATRAEKRTLRRSGGQSATQASLGALTAAASAAAPTKVEFDKVVVDLESIRTAHNALIAKLKAAGLMA